MPFVLAGANAFGPPRHFQRLATLLACHENPLVTPGAATAPFGHGINACRDDDGVCGDWLGARASQAVRLT
jgi:hypothetical protein